MCVVEVVEVKLENEAATILILLCKKNCNETSRKMIENWEDGQLCFCPKLRKSPGHFLGMQQKKNSNHNTISSVSTAAVDNMPAFLQRSLITFDMIIVRAFISAIHPMAYSLVGHGQELRIMALEPVQVLLVLIHLLYLLILQMGRGCGSPTQ